MTGNSALCAFYVSRLTKILKILRLVTLDEYHEMMNIWTICQNNGKTLLYAHLIKEWYVGKDNISKYNFYKTKNGDMWLYKNGGKGMGMHTGYNIKDKFNY